MQPCSLVYTTPFHNVAEVHQEVAVEDLSESFDLVLTDPPYNTHREVNLEN